MLPSLYGNTPRRLKATQIIKNARLNVLSDGFKPTGTILEPLQIAGFQTKSNNPNLVSRLGLLGVQTNQNPKFDTKR